MWKRVLSSPILKWKIVLRSQVFRYQNLNMMVCMQTLKSLSEKKLAGFGASQGGNLPRPQDHGPLHMLSLFVFLIRIIDTNKCPFQPNDFAGTSSRPLRLTSFITEHCDVERDHCDGFVYFHGRGQGLAAEWSALRTQRKWTQTMSRDMMNSAVARCGGRAFTPSSRIWL